MLLASIGVRAMEPELGSGARALGFEPKIWGLNPLTYPAFVRDVGFSR